MASTGLIATRQTKVGDVLKHEYVPSSGYTRELATVTVTAGMEVGAVLESTSVSGKYTLVADLTQADADAVLIDERVYDDLEAGDHTLAVLVRGPAIVANDSLSFNADVADPTVALAALKAAGILVFEQV